MPVEYTWFPQATGFIRQTLFAKRCDVVMGYAQGDELVLNTNHYYRSTYALVYRAAPGSTASTASPTRASKASASASSPALRPAASWPSSVSSSTPSPIR